MQRRNTRDSRDPRDARSGRNDRHRGRGSARRSPDDRDRRSRQSPRDDGQHKDRDGSRKPRSEERKDYPINDQGIVVSPENVARAKERRQVKNVDGKWVKPEESGRTPLHSGLA